MLRSKITEYLLKPAGEVSEDGTGQTAVEAPAEEQDGEKPEPNPELEKIIKERDRREKEMRLKHEKEAKQLKEQLETLKKEKEVLSAPPTKKGNQEERDADALAARMELLERKFQQEKAELTASLEAEKKARASAEERHKMTERDRMLRDAIDQVGVTNRTLAERYFKGQVLWDEVDETWMYETSDGRRLPIREGIELEIPPELKSSTLKAGGAGATGSTPGAKSKIQKDLDQLNQELHNIKQQIERGRGPDDALLVRYQQKKRERDILAKRLSEKGK